MASMDTLVVTLDKSSAFDRVWHAGLLENLRVEGIQGPLLMLMGDDLHGRTLHVVVKGQQSRDLKMGASVPQKSVLGPVVWNLYIEDPLRNLTVIAA